VRAEFDEDARWLVVHRGPLRVVASLGDAATGVPLGPGEAEPSVLLASDPGIRVEQRVIIMPPASLAVAAAG
jgi:maltooligosyltrehalose trehalohydrolase